MANVINIRDNTMLWEDFITVRRASRGDIVTLSDGNEYEVGVNEPHFTARGAGSEMSYIPYGSNNTADNW